MHRSPLYKYPLIAEQARQFCRSHLAPRKLQTARIVELPRSGLTNAINGAEHVWFGKLRSGATDFIPAARVHHEQAAVGILDHVGRVKIGVVGGYKIAVLGFKRGSHGFQDMA